MNTKSVAATKQFVVTSVPNGAGGGLEILYCTMLLQREEEYGERVLYLSPNPAASLLQGLPLCKPQSSYL
jgi:hypothetical protein